MIEQQPQEAVFSIFVKIKMNFKHTYCCLDNGAVLTASQCSSKSKTSEYFYAFSLDLVWETFYMMTQNVL